MKSHGNAKSTLHEYQVGDQILKKCHEWAKLGEHWDWRYAIKRAHVNGNVTVQLRTGVT